MEWGKDLEDQREMKFIQLALLFSYFLKKKKIPPPSMFEDTV